MSKAKIAPWEQGRCNTPMWLGGSPFGTCAKQAYGHQLPDRYLKATRVWHQTPYCFGHACPQHGGPSEREVRIFQDGITDDGRPMWCAVGPDFINLHESPAGFDGDPISAVTKLRAAIAKATGGA